jgi:uncharacterized protein YabE (DUF348 family)
LIGRGPLRRSHVLVISVLTAGLIWAGFLTSPSPAYAGSGPVAPSVAHVVIFTSEGSTTQHATQAATVGDFLRERGIVPGIDDYVWPSSNTPLSDRLAIEFHAAVRVTIEMQNRSETLSSSAANVSALLASQNIHLGASDTIAPALTDAIPANGIVRITRVLAWQRTEQRSIAMQTIHRIDFSLKPGTTKIVNNGRPGMREVMVSFVQRDGGNVRARIVRSRIVNKPHPRIIAEGVGEFAAFADYGSTGPEIEHTSYVTASAQQMTATAYTAGCSGCSGITAIGRRAGHGIVAVDPRVIPLGTHLFIPGYGLAIAGDTGGAIRGKRIDLGFNSLRDALLFGRREVVVYRLK